MQRVQNASERRKSFQKKIEAGKSHEEFEMACKYGTVRHAGLPESADMITGSMEVKLDANEKMLLKVAASERTLSGYKPIEKGMPCGIEQIVIEIINTVNKLMSLIKGQNSSGMHSTF